LSGPVSDVSDDPADTADVDPNSDNNPDDPTAVAFPEISVLKEITNTAVAASGVTGNYDVTYTLTVENTGPVTLSNLSLTDDIATQFGGAFAQVSSALQSRTWTPPWCQRQTPATPAQRAATC